MGTQVVLSTGLVMEQAQRLYEKCDYEKLEVRLHEHRVQDNEGVVVSHPTTTSMSTQPA